MNQGADQCPISWGTETEKLSPPGAIAAALADGLSVSKLFHGHDYEPDGKLDERPSDSKEAQAPQAGIPPVRCPEIYTY